MFFRWSESRLYARALDVREEPNAVLRRGTIATDTPLRHRLRDIGPVMLQLAITDELLSEWQRQGITRVPLLRNHGLNAEGDGGFFSAEPSPERDVYGNLEAFTIQRVNERTELAADFRFNTAQTSSEMLEAARTAPYIPTSVGFDFEEVDLTILPEKHRNGLPIVRAERWRIAEGSVTVVGKDPATHIRSQMPDRKDDRTIVLTGAQLDALLARGTPGRSDSFVLPAETSTSNELPLSEESMDQLAERVASKLDSRASEKENTAPSETAPSETAPSETADLNAWETWETLTERASEELGAAKALELFRASHGSLAAYRSAVKLALASQEKPTPPLDIAGGTDGPTRAMETFVASTLARGLSDTTAKAHWTKRATELDRGWSDRGVVRTCRDLLLATGGAYSHEQVYRQMEPVALIETARHVSTQRALDRNVEIHGRGMMYYRTASGGLVPANLPAAFQDILRIAVQSGYMRFLLPMSQLAIEQNTTTYRAEKIVDVDAALEFRPLETQEQFLPIQMREGENTVQADPYGHRYMVSEEALVNDDRRVLVGLPELFGQLYAEGKNQTFVVELSKAANFTGNQEITKNPLDYSADVLEAVSRARQKRPVSAPAGEEVGLSSGRSGALTPTAAVWGELAFNKWFARTRELGVGDGIDDRADATVHEPLVRLRSNAHMDLTLTTNVGVLWPGPETQFCPMAMGGVAGRTGIRVVATSLMDTGERDALRYTISTTFYSKALENRTHAMFKLTDESITV